MLNLEKAKKSPTIFRRITGIPPQAFEELMAALKKAYPDFERRRLSRRKRERGIGAGGKFKLSLEERVFMTLFFLRHYPTYALLGFLFELHESNAYRNVEIMKEFLREHVPLPKRVREKRISSMEELMEEMPEIELIIDATEQERQKPKEEEGRRGYYSGRKKRHSIKSQIVVEKGKGLILDVSSGWKGSIHDIRVFEETRVERKFERLKVKAWVDRGYEGIERVAIGWEIKKPKKKPEGRELREEERERNREINRERMKVEHKILAMKRYQFFGGKYRGRGKGYREAVDLLAGLVNMEQMRRIGMAWAM